MASIKKSIIKFCMAGSLVVLCLTGCGGKKAGEDEIKQKETVSKTNEKATPISQGIPVYGKKDKGIIREFLAGLPNGYLNAEEVRELGILAGEYSVRNYSKEEREYHQEKWQEFFEKSREHDQILERGKKGEAVHDIGMEIAVVMVNYTTEGDPIYDYISYINGTYCYYSDNSRDSFGSGEATCLEYEDLREYTNMEEQRTNFYLVKNADMSEKKMEEMLSSEEGYSMKKLLQVYSVDYVEDTANK